MKFMIPFLMAGLPVFSAGYPIAAGGRPQPSPHRCAYNHRSTGHGDSEEGRDL